MAEERGGGAASALVSLAVIGGLALAGRAGWRRFMARVRRNSAVLNETLPVHSKWWRERAKKPGELLYVAIGDSAAQGIGASRPDRSYVGVLARDIRSVTGRSVRVVNLSVSGATVGLAVRDQLPRFQKQRPDVVTVAIGANDIALWDAAAFELGIRALFAALPAHAIVADLPYFYLPQNERKVAVANGIVRRVAAERGLTVAPLHAETRRQGWRGVLRGFAADMFHPNDHGYRVWAAAFRPSLVASLVARFPTAGARADAASAPVSEDAGGAVA